MKPTRLFAVIALIGCAALWVFVASQSLAPRTQANELAVAVTIYVGGSTEATTAAAGSGVYLGNGYVLTARHVAIQDMADPQSDRNVLYVKQANGKTIPAVPVVISDDTDYAILKLGVPLARPAAKISCAPVTVGEPVTLVGSPLGWIENAISHGTVASLTTDGALFAAGTHYQISLDALGWSHLVIAGLPAAPGTSGGPVFDDSGNVIGVLVAGAGSYAGFIPMSAICNELPRS